MSTTTQRIADPDVLRGTLQQFYGTETWYHHQFSSVLYTDGVKFFADAAGAYWLLDILLTETVIAMRDHGEAFSMVTLKVKAGKARIEADDGDGNIFWSRDIDFTDAPEGDWDFYLVDGVLMLPSEY